MTQEDANFFDTFTGAEAGFMEAVIKDLDGVPWAQSLLYGIAANGGLKGTNKARFFELRFGYALHSAGIIPLYEVSGEAESTLDFGFTSCGQSWAVEVMRLTETQAAKKATTTRVDRDGIQWTSRHLSSDARDKRQSIEGETIKAVERICQKCEMNGRPHKFSVPANAWHTILVDFRTFLKGGDEFDRIHVGLGGEYVPDARLRMYWEGRLISGVFGKRTQLRGAVETRERVHFIGFVCERAYKAGEFAGVTQFIANPHLFKGSAAVHDAVATWPLQPARVLNGA